MSRRAHPGTTANGWLSALCRGAIEFAALCCLAHVTAGCAPVRLVPVERGTPGNVLAHGPGLEVLAIESAAGRPWTVPSTFTPIRISVSNVGAESVYVELGDITLTGLEGPGPSRALAAFPPGKITPRRRIASLGMDPSSPFIALQGVGGGSGPRVGRSETLMIEPAYHSAVERHFGSYEGSAEILRNAFAGGPIPSGQTRQGFVYFREVPADTSRWTLRIGVRQNPESAPSRVVEIGYATSEG